MSFRKQLQLDVINVLGNSVEPLSMEQVIHKVINTGFKQQRIYTDDEIFDVLCELVLKKFVKNENGKYVWSD